MATVGDLFIKLGFDVDDTKLKNFDNGVKSLRNSFVLVSAEALGAVYALERIATKSMTAATNVMNLKQQFGIDPKTTMFWEVTAQAKNFNLSLQDVDSSLSNIAQKLVQWQISGVPKWVQNMAHIQGTDSVETVMEKLRVMQQSNLSPTWKTKILGEVGVNPGMENVLNLSRQEQEALFTKLHGGYDVEKIQEAANAMAEMNVELTNLSREITVKLVPVIKDLTAYFHSLGDTMADENKSPQTIGGKIVKGLKDFHEYVKGGQHPKQGMSPAQISLGVIRSGGRSLLGIEPIPEDQWGWAPADEPDPQYSKAYKVLGYKSEADMRAAQATREEQLKNDPVYNYLKKNKASSDELAPADFIDNSDHPGGMIDTPQPSSPNILDDFIKKDKKMHPESYMDMPTKAGAGDQRTENNIDITIHAPNADGREVVEKTKELINTYSQFNNSAAV